MLNDEHKYKLIIADDEEYVRKGLSEVIDWESVGFTVDAIFDDGKDVLDYIKLHSADVVLTDVRMAHIGGLDVAKHIWESKIDTKVVLLTGYKDFDYAKKACEYGVSFYLLKPTDIKELYLTFEKLKCQLDFEIHKRLSIKRVMDNITEPFLRKLYYGAFADDNEVADRIHRLKLETEFDKMMYSIITIKINNFTNSSDSESEKKQFYSAVHNFWKIKYPNFSFAVIHQEEKEIIYIVYGQEKIEVNEKELTEEIADIFGLNVNISLRGSYDSVYRLNNKYLTDAENGKNIDLKQFIEEQKQFFSFLFSEQSEQAKELLSKMIRSLSCIDSMLMHSCIQDLFSLLSKKTHDAGIVCSEDYFKIPNAEENAAYVEKKCIENIQNIANVLDENLHAREHEAIREAKEFIFKNYSNDISLKDVANAVFLSNTYLSRIFKKYVGENYSDYLFHVRMDKAKSLLKNSNLKIYEISEKIGIQTPKYFFKVFKEYTGYTPIEYRKKALEGDKKNG